ncbi:unnamed protein product, partial [Lampetra planeri]
MGATVFVQPLDLVKNRMQLSGQGTKGSRIQDQLPRTDVHPEERGRGWHLHWVNWLLTCSSPAPLLLTYSTPVSVSQTPSVCVCVWVCSHHGTGGGGERRTAGLLLSVQTGTAGLWILRRRHSVSFLCQYDQRSGYHSSVHAGGHREDQDPEHEDDRRKTGVQERTGGAGACGGEGGLLLAVEGFHPVLRPPWSSHRSHLHLPGADEPSVQELRPGPL